MDAALAARIEWPDEALMVAITASRDELAFAVLYDRYVDLVYSASIRVLADAQLAEDASQDVFVRLWRRPETFIAERGRFLSWLMSVTRNRAVDELRARSRRRRREGGSLGEPDEGATPLFSMECEDPPRSAELHEEQVIVRRALACLPVDQQRALQLAYFKGLTQQEIATVLHEPLGTVKTRIRLGMQKLRRALEQKAD
ncbi:MAG: sigma-70 family RNA polymerase sigma factor [Tepidiformaceae bacterium]